MRKKFEEYSDKELYALMSEEKTSEAAFAELYKRHSSRVYAYCRRFLSNDAEAKDMFQEAFVRFFESSKDKDKPMSNVAAYLLRITRNLCINCKRDNNHDVSFEDYMYVEKEETNDKEELLNLIKMALELLPDEYRDIFILREYEGFTYTEIADLTSTTMNNVKVKIYRAKLKLREILQPYFKEYRYNSNKNYFEKPL